MEDADEVSGKKCNCKVCTSTLHFLHRYTHLGWGNCNNDTSSVHDSSPNYDFTFYCDLPANNPNRSCDGGNGGGGSIPGGEGGDHFSSNDWKFDSR
jgi:hypothetical protein